MPCRSDYDEAPYLGRELERVTRVACELEKQNRTKLTSLSKETQDWITEHREKDRQRLEREAREHAAKASRAAALKKLSPEEKRLLGLRG